MDQLQFKQAEQILSWRDLPTGVYIFVGKETRGLNKWMKPITVVTVKQHPEGVPIRFYAPASLHYGLENRQWTKYIEYEGVAASNSGYQFPVFKFAC